MPKTHNAQVAGGVAATGAPPWAKHSADGRRSKRPIRRIFLVIAVILLGVSCGTPPDRMRIRDVMMIDREDLFGELPAGVFKDALFEPRLSIKVPPRTFVFSDNDSWLELEPGLGFLVGRYDEVIDIVRLDGVTSDPLTSERTLETNYREIPKDVLGWLKTVPHIEVTDGTRLRTADSDVARVEVAVSGLPRHQLEDCETACVNLFVSSYGELIPIYATQRASVGVLNVRGERVLIMVAAPESTFDAFLAKTDRILASLEFA